MADPLTPAAPASTPGLSDMSIEDITPEQLELLKRLGIIPEELEDIQLQLEQANLLRNAAGPEGRDSGRVYTAANPLEHIGSLMQKYNANKQATGLEAKRSGLVGEMGKGRSAALDSLYAAALRKKMEKLGLSQEPDLNYLPES